VRRLAACFLLALGAASAGAVDVLTSRNTLGRTGVNSQERVLTPAKLKTTSFGKLWSLYADGQVVAQPLYVSGLKVDAGAVQGSFNAVLIATMHNTVYLYDADSERPGPEGRTVPLWATWLGQPRPGGKDIDMWSTSDPEWGILGTPVIDAAKSTVYVVAWHDDGGDRNYHYRLHALRLKDGTAAMPPVELQGPGLNARKQKQRTGLLLLDGVLYIGLGGDGSRGLLLAYDAATLQQRATWQVTPTGGDGGLWQAGNPPAADAQGNLYLMTGNGSFNADQPSGANYGMSFVKLRLEGNQLVVKDWFAPCNQAFLTAGDWDLGSSGPILIPGANLILGAGKWPETFLLSTDRMGRYTPPPQAGASKCANPTALQDVLDTGFHHLHGSPVYWEGSKGGHLYFWRENDLLHAFPFVNRRIVNKPVLGVDALPPGMPGAILSLSSLGKKNGILWALAPLDGDANTWRGARGVLRAIDAEDVTRTLWSSEQVAARDRPGLFAKYVPPTIAGGKVFVATYGDAEELARYGGQQRPQRFPARYQVAVYGLLPPGPAQTVDQSKPDVQLVQATTEALPAIDLARCQTANSGSLDCTAELQRVAGAPSLETLMVPPGYDFAECQLARITLASNSAALAASRAIGFYASDVTGGQFSIDHGRRTAAADLKASGQATLKGGQPATLNEFAGLVNCALGGDVKAELRMKPYMEFEGGPPPTIYRNWDPVPENHRLSSDTPAIDRRGEVLQ